MKLRIGGILIAAMFVSLPISAQQKVASIDWDLSYKSVLERNNVAKSGWIWPWLEKYKSPAEKWISGWEGKPIVSSILIEYPAFHAAEHTTMWLIRTSNEAFYWESIEGREDDKNEEPIAPQLYDAVFKQVSSWQQLEPKTAKELPEQALPGYLGFLSYNGPNESKQMLVTMDDFFICLDKTCLPGKMKSGRLMAALEPILIPESRRTYKHKSEAEIARMTPEQRIEEQISEGEHLSDLSDKQSYLIQKYRRIDGLKGSMHLIQLIETYNPKRLRDSRYSTAVMMASDIDERVIRLRASTKGRNVIEAIERISIRMIAAGKKYSYAEMDIPKLKGINFTDHAVRDTLWVKYRIKISDSELLEFSNYLVKRDPTYPGWSEKDFIKDYSRINEAGNPSQVHIFKNAKRYYHAYLAFKKPA
ncbi:MAG: hypothetical protein WKF92_08835 [Pyrinomonadaceae bacterium]